MRRSAKWISISLSEAELITKPADLQEVLRVLVFHKIIDSFELHEETDQIKIWCSNKKVELGLLCEAFLQHPDPVTFSDGHKKPIRQKN